MKEKNLEQMSNIETLEQTTATLESIAKDVPSVDSIDKMLLDAKDVVGNMSMDGIRDGEQQTINSIQSIDSYLAAKGDTIAEEDKARLIAMKNSLYKLLSEIRDVTAPDEYDSWEEAINWFTANHGNLNFGVGYTRKAEKDVMKKLEKLVPNTKGITTMLESAFRPFANEVVLREHLWKARVFTIDESKYVSRKSNALFNDFKKVFWVMIKKILHSKELNLEKRKVINMFAYITEPFAARLIFTALTGNTPCQIIARNLKTRSKYELQRDGYPTYNEVERTNHTAPDANGVVGVEVEAPGFIVSLAQLKDSEFFSKNPSPVTRVKTFYGLSSDDTVLDRNDVVVQYLEDNKIDVETIPLMDADKVISFIEGVIANDEKEIAAQAKEIVETEFLEFKKTEATE